MQPKFVEILNSKCVDCFAWTATTMKKFFGIDVLVRDRTGLSLQKQSKEQINKLVMSDVYDFGWDIVDDKPKEKDMIVFETRGLYQVGIMLEDNLVGFCNKLYPINKIKYIHVLRKQRESVKECRPLEDIFTE